jgi:hypothetical protein
MRSEHDYPEYLSTIFTYEGINPGKGAFRLPTKQDPSIPGTDLLTFDDSKAHLYCGSLEMAHCILFAYLRRFLFHPPFVSE